MPVLGAFLLGVLVAQDQDKYELAWKFREGAKFDVSWKVAMKLLIIENGKEAVNTNLTTEFSGTLTVVAVREGRAECELRLSKLAIKGLDGVREIDTLVHDAKIVRGGEDGQRLLAEFDKPARLELNRRSNYVLKEGARLLGSIVSREIEFFGPTLPDKPIAVGDTWNVELKGVTWAYRLASVQQGRAALALESEKPSENKGVKATLRMKIDAGFDVQGGSCPRLKCIGAVRGTGDESKGQTIQADTRVDFEASPSKP